MNKHEYPFFCSLNHYSLRNLCIKEPTCFPLIIMKYLEEHGEDHNIYFLFSDKVFIANFTLLQDKLLSYFVPFQKSNSLQKETNICSYLNFVSISNFF